jgi:hypothetical protein
MFQPGKETNIPTSSGAPMGMNPPDWSGKSLVSFDGKSLTLGMLILVLAVVWVWATFLKK